MYGGAAGNKDGIVYNDENWLVKYHGIREDRRGILFDFSVK